jgi:DNA-binding response OmpR family regulator
MLRMIRPCFLVVGREFPGSISTRKLVIETAKFNVLTAYSADEAVALLRLFPAVSGVVIDDGVEGISTEALIADLKAVQPTLSVVVVAAPGERLCRGADFQVRSFEPAKLLETLRAIMPREAEEIERRNERLSQEHLS